MNVRVTIWMATNCGIDCANAVRPVPIDMTAIATRREPAPSDPVGQGQNDERRHGAEADQRQRVAELRVADLEIGRDARQRGAQHPEVVLVEEETERHDAEHAEMLGRDVGDGAEEGRDPPRAPDGLRAGGHRVELRPCGTSGSTG